MEQEDLTQSFSLVKEVIGAVDRKVASYEKKVRLGEIYAKTDSKSIMRMKSGQMFAKEDLRRKKLVRDGSVFLKSTTGRLKGKTASLSVRLRRTGNIQTPCRVTAGSRLLGKTYSPREALSGHCGIRSVAEVSELGTVSL